MLSRMQAADFDPQRFEVVLEEILQHSPSLGAISSRVFRETAERVAQDVAKATGRSFVIFDETSQFAVNRMRANSLRIVQNFNAQQREAAREALTEGIRNGENPTAQARRFRNSVGLTARQQRTLNNYERALRNNSSEALRNQLRDKRSDRSVRRALANNEPLSEKQINSMVDRYRKRMIASRAKTIARTEALSAVHEGTDEMYRQARANGSLDGAKLIRTWNTAKDERVRGSHRTMHNQKRGEDELFTSGAGNSLRYPGDPNAPASERINCRCVVATQIEMIPSDFPNIVLSN